MKILAGLARLFGGLFGGRSLRTVPVENRPAAPVKSDEPRERKSPRRPVYSFGAYRDLKKHPFTRCEIYGRHKGR